MEVSMKKDSKENFILWLKKVDGQIKELINWIKLEKDPIDIIKLAKSVKHSYDGFYRMLVIGHLYGVIELIEKSEKIDRKWLVKLFQRILEELE
uniref:Metal-sensing transcriptional repressor n=1 Tax=candidate division WOR-3 bacterium TaxID=2052148 RepID=A0A7V4FDS8_UNCW3